MDRWLSEPRFRTYLTAAKESRQGALALYEWNTQLASAVFRDIGHVEVALLNAYDKAITDRWTGVQHWLFDPSSPVRRPEERRHRRQYGARAMVDINQRLRGQIDDARVRSRGRGTPGKIIAELPFGFWRYMTSRAHVHVLWVHYLRHAYPRGARHTEIDGIIGRTHVLRNQVAHHEPLLTWPIETTMRDLWNLAGMLNTNLADFIQTRSTVKRVLAARPEIFSRK